MGENKRVRVVAEEAASGLFVPEPERVALAEVNFAPYNPRSISAEEMRSLKASILRHGLVLNLVVQRAADDGTKMVLIGGHQRVTAARALCSEKRWQLPATAWATVLDIPDRQAKLLNVALNRISGEFDAYKLGKLFEGFGADLADDELLSVGFGRDEFEELVSLVVPVDDLAKLLEDEAGELMGSFARSVTLTVEFDTVERRDAIKAALLGIAKKREVKPGVVVEEALKLLAASEAANGKVEPPKKKAKR